MAVNQWMNSPSAGLSSEQDLYQDLVDENIAAGGVNVFYLPKEQINPDYLYGESTSAIFRDSFEIEMYISNIQNFNGDGDLFGKFGMTSNDEASLLVSVRRFENEARNHGLKMPRADDLIFMPLSNTMWKIRRAKPDENYYQFGRNYTYRMEVGLYQPSHEDFGSDTGVTPNDLQEADPLVDEQSLNRLLGIQAGSTQDQGDDLVQDTSSKILTDLPFDVNNPFGG